MKPITIVGGGLAGLTLGIALRRQNVPVTIFEAGRYPRHRVCGEFISGRGQKMLEQLGLTEKFLAAGARMGHTTAFFSSRAASKVNCLPEPALCLSRYTMDLLLAEEFRRCGGDLKENVRWTENYGEGIVRATGRRIRAETEGWRWFGLKVHARKVNLIADLEMHLTRQGYIGLCKLNDEDVNICGLFRSREPVPNLAADWKKVLCGEPGSELWRRLSEAELDEKSFCSVAGVCFQPDRASSHEELCLGDAITMIPPVTGNGMSMAFESAEIAARFAEQFSRGKMTWNETKKGTAWEFDRQFAKRLAWADRLQRVLFQPGINSLLIRFGLHFQGVWRCFFHKTR